MSYRMDLYNVSEQAVESRGLMEYSHYAFPEEISNETDADIPPQVKSKIQSMYISCNIRMPANAVMSFLLKFYFNFQTGSYSFYLCFIPVVCNEVYAHNSVV